jgi:hypothetical protein
MTTRDIRAHLREIYGVEVSADLISRVTDTVIEELAEWQGRPFSGSGRRRDTYVEGDGLRGGVVVTGVALERKADGREAVLLGFFPGCRAATVDVQGGHAIVPVPGLVVVKQLHPERTHGEIILEFPQFIKGVSVVASDPGHGRAAEVHTVMVGPDPLLVSLDEHAVGARAPGLDPPISLQRREDTRSLGHARTVEHPADRTGKAAPQPVHLSSGDISRAGLLWLLFMSFTAFFC